MLPDLVINLVNNLRKKMGEFLGRQQLHRWYSGASENGIVGAVCGSRIKMRSSYNMIQQALHHGQSSIEPHSKQILLEARGVLLLLLSECLFLAHSHWTWRWQNENRGEISIPPVSTVKGGSCLPPLKHRAFHLLCHSFAFSLVGEEVEWRV